MKTVFVTVKGKGPVYWMVNLNEGVKQSEVDTSMSLFDLEDKGLVDGDLFELPFILEDVEVFYTEGSEPVWNIEAGIDITKENGKCLLINDLLSEECKLKSPFWVKQTNYCSIIESFMIELDDREEFEPKKLQLIKSDYEVQFLPFGISVYAVVYDGKLVYMDPSEGYNVESYKQFVYDESQPYASSPKSVSIKTFYN